MTQTMRVAKSEYTRYSLLIGTLMILSVGLLEQLPQKKLPWYEEIVVVLGDKPTTMPRI